MHSNVNNRSKRILLLFLMIVSMEAYAVDSFDEILTNVQTALPALIDLIFVVSFVGGLYFMVRGLMMLKQMGASLTQMTRPGELGGPLAYIIIGSLLIYLPTTINITHESIFSVGSNYISGSREATEIVYGYGDGGSIDEQWESLKNVLYKYIQFIGLISFVRGLFIMAKSGQPGVQPGVISKGIVHLLAGVIAMNVKGFIEILKDTMGI